MIIGPAATAGSTPIRTKNSGEKTPRQCPPDKLPSNRPLRSSRQQEDSPPLLKLQQNRGRRPQFRTTPRNGPSRQAKQQLFSDSSPLIPQGEEPHCHAPHENCTASDPNVSRHPRNQRNKKEDKGQNAADVGLKRGDHSNIEQTCAHGDHQPRRPRQETFEQRLRFAHLLRSTRHICDRLIGNVLYRIQYIFIRDHPKQTILLIDHR